MKSAQCIIDNIARCIGHRYHVPENVARDFGDLDSQLHLLHWLYANALEVNEKYLSEKTMMFLDNVKEEMELISCKDKHVPINSLDDARPVLTYWQSLDAKMGWVFPCESIGNDES